MTLRRSIPMLALMAGSTVGAAGLPEMAKAEQRLVYASQVIEAYLDSKSDIGSCAQV